MGKKRGFFVDVGTLNKMFVESLKNRDVCDKLEIYVVQDAG